MKSYFCFHKHPIRWENSEFKNEWHDSSRFSIHHLSDVARFIWVDPWAYLGRLETLERNR